MPGGRGATTAAPRVRIAAECARRGRAEVVAGCAAILNGDDPEPALLIVLGGSAASRLLVGDSRADIDLWSRVWALRGLLWTLDPATAEPLAPLVVTALRHPAWRVREKAAQVAARHLIDAALDDLVARRDSDPTPRVRAAAARAVQRLTAGS